jgi:anaerobic magnesium-protoporphyrin IX monomethyl ester cyclase
MNVALIYPPTCDPTAPYISVPMLTAYLRHHGVSVIPIDANIEAYDRLLRGAVLRDFGQRITRRLERLSRKKALSHTDQLLYFRLWEVGGEILRAPDEIEEALAILKDRSGVRFFDPVQYEKAIQTVQAGLRIISAAHSPLMMDFTAYRTPFALLNPDQIRADAEPGRNPFHDYFEGALCDVLAEKAIDMVGISLAFPGQLQPGYALAYALRRKRPHLHICVGGPAITQLLARFPEEKIEQLLGPFHSVVLYEGEKALLALVRMMREGRMPPRVIHGERDTDLSGLPAPDFDRLPLEKYLSPEPVLPYDPTRGCYWGKCAFCHYGLSPAGTAGYRQRPLNEVVDHLAGLNRAWGCRTFYFSQDAFLPQTARKIAKALNAADISIRWGTDMRPETALTPECCRDLKAGGAISVALGIESAAPRVLERINKGISLKAMGTAVKNLAEAGIAAEAMCFRDFPTETYTEAHRTLSFIETMRDQLSLFICGRFGLCHGSLVAKHPAAYGIEKIWLLCGDELGTGLFYREGALSKTGTEVEKIDRAINTLSRGWWLHDYPWAGALSTAHTLLWVSRYGPAVFKRLAGTPRNIFLPKKAALHQRRSRVSRMIQNAFQNEAEIWRKLVDEYKAVSPALYSRLSRGYPAVTLSTTAGRR